jgi:uncharacterized protein
MLEFEWDDEKAKSNLAKHSLAFSDARRLFDDAYALHYADRSVVYEEER